MPAKSPFTTQEKDIIKHNLCLACEQSWLKDGYKKTSIRELCTQTNISIGTFYVLFETKKALFFETMVLIQTRMRETLIEKLEEEPNTQGIKNALIAIMELCLERPMLFDPSFNSVPYLFTEAQLRAIQKHGNETIRFLFNYGKLENDVDPKLAEAVIMTLFMSVRQQKRINNDYSYRSVYTFMVDKLVGSLFTS